MLPSVIFGQKEDFERVFDDGALKEFEDYKATGINLDGKGIPGQKVELLDEYQVA